jgi:hypothetical protein
MALSREGCCETWPKPCSYHEGVQDALDVVEMSRRRHPATDVPERDTTPGESEGRA